MSPHSPAWACTSRSELAERALQWVTAPALTDLVARLGGPVPDAGLPSLRALRRWTASTLDTRRGVERREAPVVRRPAAQRQMVVDAARQLGLVETPDPTLDVYDSLIVLAGATTGNRLRTALARALLSRVRATDVVAVASDRPLTSSEHDSDPDSRADRTEWRHLRRCLDDEFGPLRCTDRTDPGDGGIDLSYEAPGDVAVRMLVAPEVNGIRPNTTQQLRYLRARSPFGSHERSLLVTSAIYAPYQFFAACRELIGDPVRHLELVGTPTSVEGCTDVLAQRLLQEIHAGVHAAVDIVDA